MKRGVIFFFGFVFSWLLLLPTSGMGQELESFYENGKYGFRDRAGQTVIPPKYDDVDWGFCEGLAEVKLNGKWGFIDESGTVVVPLKYDRVDPFCEGLGGVDLNGKCGFVDKNGAVVIPLKYDAIAWGFSEGLPRVYLNGKGGYIDKSGAVVIPLQYDEVGYFSEGLAGVKLNGKWGFIDKSGAVVVPLQYDEVDYYGFHEGLAWVKLNDKCGFVDKSGTEVIPLKYDDAGFFSEGLAKVELNGKWGFVDKSGAVVIPLQYDVVYDFSEGLASVELNGKWGFIDKSGAVVIPLQYDYAFSFSEGLADVKLNDKWGFIDKSGAVVIPLQYDGVYSFSEGLADVKLNDKKGFVDKSGRWYDSCEDCFPFYAKTRVEKAINEWQIKGAYEKTSAWQARVTEASRQAKIAELTKGVEVKFLAQQQQKATLNLSLGAYDADNEVFLVTMNQRDSLLVPVPITDAASFEQAFASIEKNPRYVIANDRLTLAELTLTVPSGKSYKYNNQTSLDYAVAAVDYNFDPIEIDLNTETAPKGKQTISTVNVSIGKSDVDTDIPTTTVSNNKTFAVIIANEHYQREAKVEFAQNDGKTFKTYCLKTLGMPEENIHFVADATLNNLRVEIDWLTQVARNFSGAAKIIFYYAGHGIPDVETEAAYLLPTDGYGSNVISGYKLSDLYKSLSSYPTQAAIVFLDACFSGAQRSGEMLASARGVAIKVKEEAPAGNMIVFAATQGDQTAYPYRDKGHGLFTYYLLQKLQQTKGNTTLGELATFLTTNVREKSIVTNRKSQIPSITPSAAIAEDWKTLRLK